jgi:hypothetical protein
MRLTHSRCPSSFPSICCTTLLVYKKRGETLIHGMLSDTHPLAKKKCRFSLTRRFAVASDAGNTLGLMGRRIGPSSRRVRSRGASRNGIRTPVIGTEFGKGHITLAALGWTGQRHDYPRTRAILGPCPINETGIPAVIRFVCSWTDRRSTHRCSLWAWCRKDINVESRRSSEPKFGELTGKPKSSTLYVQ